MVKEEVFFEARKIARGFFLMQVGAGKALRLSTSPEAPKPRLTTTDGAEKNRAFMPPPTAGTRLHARAFLWGGLGLKQWAAK